MSVNHWDALSVSVIFFWCTLTFEPNVANLEFDGFRKTSYRFHQIFSMTKYTGGASKFLDVCHFDLFHLCLKLDF